MLLRKLIQLIKKGKRNINPNCSEVCTGKQALIEIFNTKTGNTLFYIRLFTCPNHIENYMKQFHSDLTSWDYEIVS